MKNITGVEDCSEEIIIFLRQGDYDYTINEPAAFMQEIVEHGILDHQETDYLFHNGLADFHSEFDLKAILIEVDEKAPILFETY